MSIIPVDNFNRDLSSSEDQCKCPSCKNQDDIRLAKRTLCTLYSYRHKKRQGPPTKKDNAKDVSQKPKCMIKKDQLQRKNDCELKPTATPFRQKPNEKAKDTLSPSMVGTSHPVSHSQRLKFIKSDLLMSIPAESGPRREQGDQRYRNNARCHYDPLSLKLAQVSENPENIRMRLLPVASRSSSHHQASPPCVMGRVSAEHRTDFNQSRD